MIKVYVVKSGATHEGFDIIGIFSTREAAETHVLTMIEEEEKHGFTYKKMATPVWLCENQFISIDDYNLMVHKGKQEA